MNVVLSYHFCFSTMKKGLKRELGQACKNRPTDDDSIQSLFKKYKEESHGDLQCAQMMMNIACSKIDLSRDIFQSVPLSSRTEALYTIYIKCLCENTLLNEALNALAEMIENNIHPHVRTFISFFQTNVNAQQFEILIQYIFKYDLIPTMELFELIFENIPDCNNLSIFKLFKLLSDHYYFVSDKLIQRIQCIQRVKVHKCTPTSDVKCDHCNSDMNPIDITNHQTQLMINCLKYPGIEHLDNFVKNKNIKLVIDGSNVAMYNNSTFNFNKIMKLLKHLQSPSASRDNILIVFHIGRKKLVDQYVKKHKISIPEGVYIWYSKIGQDDDLSWLYSTLLVGGKCVTSDKLRDHLYYRFSQVIEQHVFERWVELHLINFSFETNSNQTWNVKTVWPRKIISRTIFDEHKKSIHLPTIDTLSNQTIWWCASLQG